MKNDDDDDPTIVFCKIYSTKDGTFLARSDGKVFRYFEAAGKFQEIEVVEIGPVANT